MNTIDLHYYARRNSVHDMKEAIRSGLNINGRDAFGCTPLHCAIGEKSVDAAMLLLERGADVTAKDEGDGYRPSLRLSPATT